MRRITGTSVLTLAVLAVLLALLPGALLRIAKSGDCIYSQSGSSMTSSPDYRPGKPSVCYSASGRNRLGGTWWKQRRLSWQTTVSIGGLLFSRTPKRITAERIRGRPQTAGDRDCS